MHNTTVPPRMNELTIDASPFKWKRNLTRPSTSIIGCMHYAAVQLVIHIRCGMCSWSAAFRRHNQFARDIPGYCAIRKYKIDRTTLLPFFHVILKSSNRCWLQSIDAIMESRVSIKRFDITRLESHWTDRKLFKKRNHANLLHMKVESYKNKLHLFTNCEIVSLQR